MAKSLSYAILNCKCPRCRSGNMFLKKPSEKWFNKAMHKSCSVCNQSFEPEPGFYFGAMFVSYAFSVAITFVTIVSIYLLFGEVESWIYVTSVIFMVLILWPLMFRYSRSIFLNVFGGIRYRPNDDQSS